MKINNFNLTFEWDTLRPIPDYFGIYEHFPSYDVIIKNGEDELVQEFKNVEDYEPYIDHTARKIPGCPKIKFYSSVSKNKAKNIFKYNFINNFLKYKELKNKLGFFKKLKFQIKYNNSINNFEKEIEYDEIENLNKNILFNKIYRSSDYMSAKMLINKNYFDEKNIHSFLILSQVSNKILKNKKLNNLFVENVKEKWLDVSNSITLLTIPFIETDIVEISENLNIKIIPLNYFQSEVYKFLIEQNEKQEDINNLYEDFFPNQVFDIGKIYKQASNNETVAFYQNYIYLFNTDSIETNSLQTDLTINDMVFNKYLPLLNKGQENKTVCLSDDLNTDNVLDNSYNLQKDYLGYYDKNLIDYEDIAMDVDYLQNQGIRSAKILEIEELPDTCNIYIEFITSFYNNEKFYIETSNNLKFYEKYKTTIEDKEYITLLFKYSYNLEYLNQYLSQNLNINKNQIIAEKDLINFSAKLIV